MFIYMFIGCSVFYVLEAVDILSVLWHEKGCRFLKGGKVPSEETNIIVDRLSQVPFTNLLKFDAWNKLSPKLNVENFKTKDWKTYQSLIPHLPMSFLEKVNMTDDSIVSFFGQVKLSRSQLVRLSEEVKLQNKNIFESEEKIQNLGNIICGFSERELSTIKDSMLRSLLKNDFFQKINHCNIELLRSLLKRVGKHTVVGPPRTWCPETVRQAGNLISGLSESEIREIREKSFSQISSKVIELAPVEILKAFTDSQLKTLNRSALLSWRRKTRDLKYLSRSSGCSVKVSFSAAPLIVFLTKLNLS